MGRTLFLLNAPIELANTPKAGEVRAAMQGHAVGQAELAAQYTRGR